MKIFPCTVATVLAGTTAAALSHAWFRLLMLIVCYARARLRVIITAKVASAILLSLRDE